MEYWYDENEVGDLGGIWVLLLIAPFIIGYAWLWNGLGRLAKQK